MPNQYLEKVIKKYKTGITTEHSFRSDLQIFVESLVKNIQAINEPTRQKCGAPDLIVQQKGIPLGYIEAKDIGIDLDTAEKSSQLKRYLKSLDNLILTDYLEFRFYFYGQKQKTIRIAEIENGKIKPNEKEFVNLAAHIRDFCNFKGQTIKSAKQLATMMAQKAVMMKDVLYKAVQETEESNSLKQQMDALKIILIHDLDEKTFADIYAQTITYGLFVARLSDKTLETFSRQEARELISKSNPFLRSFFDYISGADLDDRVVWIVDDLVEIFRSTDLKKLLKNYGVSTEQTDPFLHFYETFLEEYDKETKEKRGVYYTPQPIVKFIVQSVDDILKDEFSLSNGLADTSKVKIKIEIDSHKKNAYIEEDVYKVQILDPATGTGTFLAETINNIHKRFINQQGMWNNYVDEALIPRLNGFELLMTPYVMCHLKLEMLLQETGYEPTKGKANRFNVYLTNTLEKEETQKYPLFTNWLAEEAKRANFIKRNSPIMVVMGNPPYSGHSASKTKLLDELLEDYKKEPSGVKLKEKNSKWINDDYVKFIRYAQMLIDKNKEGVLAYINNHSFLDNPTFRGMRYNLLNSFDKIYIIDLHGNAKKKEICPDGSVDSNVFNIQQGVSINIFVKTGSKKKNELAKVYHKDIYGSKQIKYDFCTSNTLKSVAFTEVPLNKPNYFFVPKDFDLKKVYDKGISVNELFKINSVGVVTARDDFITDINKNTLLDRVRRFFDYDNNEIINIFKLKENTSFNISNVKSKSKFNQDFINKISYRPFDEYYIYYDTNFIERPRLNIMKHFINGGNLGLVSVKKQLNSMPVSYYFLTKNIISNGYIRSDSVSIDSVFPLYIYIDTDQKSFFEKKRIPNLDTAIVKELEKKLKLTFTTEKETAEKTFAPIDVLDYIYGILHSNKYRETYKEFLKIDFPKIPYPDNAEYFFKIGAFGSELRQLHLLESEKVNNLITTYPINGDNEVKKIEYKDGKVFINAVQYFDNVPKEAWEFYIGGYQPAQKWLKDRKDRILNYDDVFHYQKIIVALTETYRLMREIDGYE